MELQNVVPWGRSLTEYQRMFSLNENDLTKHILGCGDGPASFNMELTERGGDIVSIDPAYEFDRASFENRIAEVFDEIMHQMHLKKDNFIWDDIGSVDELGKIRMSAMDKFLSDYSTGKKDGRYLQESLPALPFKSQQFDLALCSHYLFLYSDHVDLEHHILSMKELCRVAAEVRVYPLLSLDGQLSPHVKPVLKELTNEGFEVSLVPVEYQFQKGATEMMVVTNKCKC